jgi:predicted TIM-barrel enzyme
MRPDTINIISGTLKKTYLLRNYFNKERAIGKENRPCIFVDLQKKHTVFPESLNNIESWLDNIRFMKIEGIILSGKYTGCSIDDEDFKRARVFVDRLKIAADPIDIPIIAGSGASVKNIVEYKKYCDAIIVGSSIKKNGNWESPIDELELKHFMDLYSS